MAQAGGAPAATSLVAAVLPVAYQVFRMAFFAALVPNTALAKQATAPHVEEGWAYVVDLVGTYQLWIPLAALAVAAVVVGRRLSGRSLVARGAAPRAPGCSTSATWSWPGATTPTPASCCPPCSRWSHRWRCCP